MVVVTPYRMPYLAARLPTLSISIGAYTTSPGFMVLKLMLEVTAGVRSLSLMSPTWNWRVPAVNVLVSDRTWVVK